MTKVPSAFYPLDIYSQQVSLPTSNGTLFQFPWWLSVPAQTYLCVCWLLWKQFVCVLLVMKVFVHVCYLLWKIFVCVFLLWITELPQEVCCLLLKIFVRVCVACYESFVLVCCLSWKIFLCIVCYEQSLCVYVACYEKYLRVCCLLWITTGEAHYN